MQRRIRVFRLRRDHQSEVAPVIEILRFIAAHAPVPYIRLAVREFLIFTVPIIFSVKEHHRAAVRVYGFPLGICPKLSRTKTVVHTFITSGFRPSFAKPGYGIAGDTTGHLRQMVILAINMPCPRLPYSLPAFRSRRRCRQGVPVQTAYSATKLRPLP